MKSLEKIENDVTASFWQVIGPLFILCSFALAPNNLLIFCVGAIGLFLCSRLQMTGFLFSFVLLVLASVAEHLFFAVHGLVLSHHLWLFGLEGSYAVALFITALNAERHTHFVQSLCSQVEVRSSSIANLEEEYAKSLESATAQQVLAQEKIGALQARLDETLSDQSSLLILNEVLRNATAKEIEEKEALGRDLLDAQIRLESIQTERDALHGELTRFKNVDALTVENQRLIDEINAARIDKEQTHLINETIVRLHAKENARAQSALEMASSLTQEKQELEVKLSSLAQELEAMRAQLEQITRERDGRPSEERVASLTEEKQQLDAKVFDLEKELEAVRAQLEQITRERDSRPSEERVASLTEEKQRLDAKVFDLEKELEMMLASTQLEKDRHQVALGQLASMQAESQVLSEKLMQTEATLAQKEEAIARQAIPVATPEDLLLMAHLEEKVKILSQTEALYKQLKAQFAEKNEILHKTRSQLFHTDTELQTLKIEIEGSELSKNSIPKEIISGLVDFDEKIADLQRENEELQQLVTILSSPVISDTSKRRKVKIIPDQEYLFS